MPNFLSQLTKSEEARLLEELNYMNLEEIRGFCSARGIPFRVVAELAMEFWTRGEAPTFEEFARSWTKTMTDRRHQHPDAISLLRNACTATLVNRGHPTVRTTR